VTDLVSHQTTSLSPRSIHIEGHMVAVNVPGSLLPSTGLPPAQYRFNYWTEDPDPTVSQPIASFDPEFNDAQVGVAGGQDGLMGMGMEGGHRRSMG